jgi:hypothetical protein
MKVNESVLSYVRLAEQADLAEQRRKMAWQRLGANERAQALKITRMLSSTGGPPLHEMADSEETTDVDVVVRVFG